MKLLPLDLARAAKRFCALHIRTVDDAVLRVLRSKSGDKEQPVVVHDQPMTPELSGAMFGGGKE